MVDDAIKQALEVTRVRHFAVDVDIKLLRKLQIKDVIVDFFGVVTWSVKIANK